MNATERAVIDCLDDQILRDFNSGGLQDSTLEERVAEHLGLCTKCESRLESLDESENRILELLRQPDPLEPLIEAGLLAREESLASTKSRLKSRLRSTETGEFKYAVPSAVALPVRIDRYFVIRELGNGGFAQVFLAKDPDLDRLVAIKVPRSDRLATKESRAAFLREARTAAEFGHPNIVPVYDCRELEDGRCIVVMKYIEGRTLRQAMKSERFDHDRVVMLISKIADALHYAHTRKIWHRDIKPANILLDRNDQPHIADFGLALHEDEQHLHENEFAGTYPYMSPEQIQGNSHHLDGRSDIWSLGVVFYELLTRRQPFSCSTIAELKTQIVTREPQVPRMIDETIPPALESICLRCLRKAPADRFSTARDLGAALTGTQKRKRGLLSAVSLIGILFASLLLFASAAVWFDRTNGSESAWKRELGVRPTEIVWPGYRGTGTRSFDEHGLTIVSNDIRLMKLGEYLDGGFRFSVNIKQPDWSSQSGIFIGYRLLEYQGQECATFQLIWLEPMEQVDFNQPPGSWQTKFYLRRAQVVIATTTASLVELKDLGAAMVKRPTNLANPALEIAVSHAKLESVRWDGESLDALIAPERAARTSREDFRGPWGLFHFYGSVWFTEPRFENLR